MNEAADGHYLTHPHYLTSPSQLRAGRPGCSPAQAVLSVRGSAGAVWGGVPFKDTKTLLIHFQKLI